MANGNGNGQGKTLWEMFKERLNQADTRIAFYNPLDYRVGALVSLAKGHPEFQAYDFTIKEILEFSRRIGGQAFKFTDYALAGTNTQSFNPDDALTLRLRVVPNQAGAHDALLLRLDDEFAFDPSFLEVVKDTTGVFEVTDDDTGETVRYERINEVKDPYEAAVLLISETTEDAKAAPSKTKLVKLEYWDYWRDVPIGEGPATKKQFLFVELNSDTGWFQIWQGEEFFL